MVPRVAAATGAKAQEQGMARVHLSPEELRRSAEEKIAQARKALRALVSEGVIVPPSVTPC